MNVMIKSFRCKDSEALYNGESPRRFRAIETVATRKLQMLDAAHDLKDLRSPPGNRLEQLRRDRADQHSIRINGQWRICFCWTSEGVTEVEIVDYH
ncbi:MAG TPA: type II toxin-antitoxin system RelE/ParE family toxin [Paraburkholderia sp.]|jgi:proteic killer suppression protein|nr:type II toxin-antitoxin system RelE/ParE family toxin [Paraburkholderia sp.]